MAKKLNPSNYPKTWSYTSCIKETHKIVFQHEIDKPTELIQVYKCLHCERTFHYTIAKQFQLNIFDFE